ncbi:hypothetical protein EVAR_32682_1 [Eumeta japonica]|uniref:Uncharacterized protein n=1 Tax=Eumeta variegata TaxID=151549 RepID=A0A4C1VR24_EUMVA|nr:hypothetical protein EVAR_32682_1 [Eumeta japonica]
MYRQHDSSNSIPGEAQRNIRLRQRRHYTEDESRTPAGSTIRRMHSDVVVSRRSVGEIRRTEIISTLSPAPTKFKSRRDKRHLRPAGAALKYSPNIRGVGTGEREKKKKPTDLHTYK